MPTLAIFNRFLNFLGVACGGQCTHVCVRMCTCLYAHVGMRVCTHANTRMHRLTQAAFTAGARGDGGGVQHVLHDGAVRARVRARERVRERVCA